MKDESKTKKQLIAELCEERQKVAELMESNARLEETGKELRENDERFRQVFEHSRDALYMRNLETGQYEYMSPSIANITGFTPAEVMAMSSDEIDSLIHPEDRERISDIKRKVLENFHDLEIDTLAEYRLKCKDGTYRWISDHYTLFRNPEGGQLVSIASVRDITERKDTEIELRNWEEKYGNGFTRMRLTVVR